MSEEEIIKNVKRIIEYKVISNYINDNDSRAIQGLLDLYNKEKEKNIELEELLDDRLWNEHIHKETDKMWKDKIKEKIEEIYTEKLNYSEDEYYLESEIKGYAIEHLNEILEESEE